MLAKIGKTNFVKGIRNLVTGNKYAVNSFSLNHER